MTLDEILHDMYREATSKSSPFTGIPEAAQAIRAEIERAKPSGYNPEHTMDSYKAGFNEALEEYHANLIRELGLEEDA